MQHLQLLAEMANMVGLIFFLPSESQAEECLRGILELSFFVCFSLSKGEVNIFKT